MTVATFPKTILAKRSGCMELHCEGEDVALFIREQKIHVGDYPRSCHADVKLPTWDSPPILAIALLARLARRELMTFQSWINGGNPTGVRTIQALARQRVLDIHLVTEEGVARTLRCGNTVRGIARRIVGELERRAKAWSDDKFEEVCGQIDRLYPTPSGLWRNT